MTGQDNGKHYLSKKKKRANLFFFCYNRFMNFTKDLLNWYTQNKRTLVFRDDHDPYKIWISEVMAQQTQIATMLPYYERWIERFPNVEDVANASIDEILKMWEGLGYYRRARNLHKGAQYVVEHFNGELPKEKKDLMTIPGIGDYTASAIASIAFEKPEIPVDGNVKRVMARYMNYQENVNTRAAHKLFEDFLKNEMIQNKAIPSQFGQALMELGALVCTKHQTKCEQCPLQKACLAYQNGTVGQLPIKPKAKKVPSYKKSVLLYIKDKQILVSNDDRDGLMKGLLRLPQIDGHSRRKDVYRLKHQFSHLIWDIRVYPIDTIPDFDFDVFLIPIESLDDISMVTAHRKILKHLLKE